MGVRRVCVFDGIEVEELRPRNALSQECLLAIAAVIGEEPRSA